MSNPKYVESVIKKTVSTIEMSSPFSGVKVAFNWLNRDYPYYHEHTHWEVLVIMAGEIVHNINGVKQTLKKGDACILRPMDKHSLTFKRGANQNEYQHINFTFDNDLAQQLFTIYGNYRSLLQQEEPIKFTLTDKEIEMIHDKALITQMLPKQPYEQSTLFLLSTILLRFFEQRLWYENKEYPDWFNEFLIHIGNPRTFDQSVYELVKVTSYSYSYMARVFKGYTGISMNDYINDKKMSYSKKLLKTTRLTVQQIAEQLGYSSCSTFNHFFKKYFGVTPSEYRKEHNITSFEHLNG